MKDSLSNSVRPLLKRYHLLVAMGAMFLFAILILLLIFQLSHRKATELGELRTATIQLSTALDGVVKEADDHIQRLRDFAENYDQTFLAKQQNPLRNYLTSHNILDSDQCEGVLFLDSVLGSDLEYRVGNLWVDKIFFTRSPKNQQELNMALGMFELFHLCHKTTPFFQWSYYISASREFSTISPWRNSERLIKNSNVPTLAEFRRQTYQFPGYLMGTPEENKLRHSYWTPAYWDFAGAGLMVTHGAPVYWGDKFMGIVGADITLSVLTEHLRPFRNNPGMLWIVNDHGQVLADLDAVALVGPNVSFAKDVLPPPAYKMAVSHAQPTKEFQSVDGRHILIHPVDKTPWKIIYVISNTALTKTLLPEFIIYTFVFIALLITALGLHTALRHQLVAPAILLVDFIKDHSMNLSPTMPGMPKIWRQWFGKVEEVFGDNRNLMTLLNKNAEALEAEVSDRTRELNKKSKFLELTLENMNQGILVVDKNNEIKLMNRWLLERYNLPLKTITRCRGYKELLDLLYLNGEFGKGDRETITRRHFENATNGQPSNIEHVRPNRNVVEVLTVPLPDGGFVRTYQDITKRKRVERELKKEKDFIDSILLNSFDGIAVATLDGYLKFISPGMERIFGFAPGKIKSLEQWLQAVFPHPTKHRRVRQMWLRDIEKKHPPVRILRFTHADGSERWCRFRFSHMPEGDIVINGQDITDIKRAEEQIRHLAMRDPLTKLPNRKLFNDRLKIALAKAKRENSNMALLFVDLDGLKYINDNHGHEYGDLLLQDTADKISDCLRESDTVARFGGDEFVVILSDLEDPAEAANVAIRINTGLLQSAAKKENISSGASIGISIFPVDGEDGDALVNKADKAMYLAKSQGGNRFRFASDL